ncbi:ABC transporter ATP-binding protein [Actinokineospora xionganensis]|uniref:ABC transporter ATP-binding protein n=1 Tax=Actinokineospora xionganensis TaxID=2684470 RepID=A0ABR7KZU0_9PSEU|nr:ABC transporter ATP-binding protein [Actinokineospora xionganensis]MBC6445951.1 ABC transporter ATP-binding protein [Actinokineospora xionganensis]
MSTELLRATGLRKRFGGVVAVDSIDLHINEAEFVAIVGRSGSGKSTLLNLIAGLDLPDEGEIRFAGELLRANDEDALADWRAEHVGLVFQAFHLIPTLSALDNAAVPLLPRRSTEAARAAARERLDQVGLGNRVTHRPAQLSGGEQQRVAIARALVGNPKLLLADEPTGNLDTKTGKEILDLFARLRADTGTATVLITHDENVAAAADRRISIQDGKVLAEAGEGK